MTFVTVIECNNIHRVYLIDIQKRLEEVDARVRALYKLDYSIATILDDARLLFRISRKIVDRRIDELCSITLEDTTDDLLSDTVRKLETAVIDIDHLKSITTSTPDFAIGWLEWILDTVKSVYECDNDRTTTTYVNAYDENTTLVMIEEKLYMVQAYVRSIRMMDRDLIDTARYLKISNDLSYVRDAFESQRIDNMSRLSYRDDSIEKLFVTIIYDLEKLMTDMDRVKELDIVSRRYMICEMEGFLETIKQRFCNFQNIKILEAARDSSLNLNSITRCDKCNSIV